jgi:hypothetical protein
MSTLTCKPVGAVERLDHCVVHDGGLP